MNNQKYDVIIVGGGLVGNAFALSLAVKNPQFNIAIITAESMPPVLGESLDNKIYAISPTNINYLKTFNGWPVNSDRIGTIKYMDVKGDMSGRIFFDAKNIYQEYLAKTIESNNLQLHLVNELNKLSNVTVINDILEDIKINEDNAQIVCNNNTCECSLIVGADGANSLIRKLSGLEMRQIAYDQKGIVANFKCEKPHNNVAYQWFHQSNILAYLPLPDNQISIVWSNKNAEELINLDEEEFTRLVEKAGQYTLGNLKLITKPAAFTLKLQLVDKFYKNRILLIGDAAHTIHPLAGQGLNLGFGDIQVLNDILASMKNYQLGDKSLLAKYNALRLAKVREMQLTCHVLYNLFDTDKPFIGKLRNFGLNLVNSMPLIKKYLISRAVKY